MTLRELKETGEFEAKLAMGGLPKSLWDTYSAFANTDGGIIALGIEEDKNTKALRPVGIPEPGKMLKQFWDAVNNRECINLNILSTKDVTIEDIGGKKVILIRVPRAERHKRPIYVGGNPMTGTYRRQWEGDYRCSADEVQAMLRDRELGVLDRTIVLRAEPADLDMESVHHFRNRMGTCRSGHVWLKLDDETFLLRLGVLDRDEFGVLRPTRAGLLMFGFEYAITREFPHYFLDYREKFDADTRWTDRVESSSGDWSGNVFDFYFRVYNKLSLTLKVPFKMVGGDRIDDTPVHKSIREALANCLVNADYYLPRGVVVIRDRESLSFSNPGGFRIPIATAMSGGISEPRNATILKLFNLIDIGERTGSGIPLIDHTWKDMNWPQVMVKETHNPDRTEVVLSLPYTVGAGGINQESGGINQESGGINQESGGINQESGGIKYDTESQDEALFDIVSKHPGSKVEAIQLITGFACRSIERSLARLIESKKIEYRGSKKTGGYYRLEESTRKRVTI